MYLQIEEATRLTVRLSERSGHARQTHDFRIKKAGRFRGGASAAVAEVTFGDGESYLALKDGGIVDMDATMRRLDRMREFIAGFAMTSDMCSLRNRTASLLKASPKGEGFHPPSEWKVIKSFRHHVAQRGGPDKQLSLLFLSWGRENMG